MEDQCPEVQTGVVDCGKACMGTGGTARSFLFRMEWRLGTPFSLLSVCFGGMAKDTIMGWRTGLRTQGERAFPATFWRGQKQSTHKTSET